MLGPSLFFPISSYLLLPACVRHLSGWHGLIHMLGSKTAGTNSIANYCGCTSRIYFEHSSFCPFSLLLHLLESCFTGATTIILCLLFLLSPVLAFRSFLWRVIIGNWNLIMLLRFLQFSHSFLVYCIWNFNILTGPASLCIKWSPCSFLTILHLTHRGKAKLVHAVVWDGPNSFDIYSS